MLTGSLAAAAGLLTYDNTTVMLLNRSPSQAQAYLPLAYIIHTGPAQEQWLLVLWRRQKILA